MRDVKFEHVRKIIDFYIDYYLTGNAVDEIIMYQCLKIVN
jgi:hypothetical protein